MTLPYAAEVAACRAAQFEWSRRTVAERLKPIRKLRHLLVERSSEICDTVRAEIGRPDVEVIGTELLPTAAAMKFLLKEAGSILKPRRVRSTPIWLIGSRDVVHRRPWGIVGIIGTWNYPIYLNVIQIAQALVVGNGVLWKPSEVAPRTADLIHRLFLDAGIPPALLQKLPATREGGAQLAEADVDHVVFTGSDRVGRKLAARLGERLIPSTLELSGIDAMFVLEDADMAMALHAVWFGVTLNRGQTCIAVRRVFVPRKMLSEGFLERFLEFSGSSKRKSASRSALPNNQREWIQALLDAAKTHTGMRIRVMHSPWPSTADAPNQIIDAPVFLISPDATPAICREPVFGPVATFIPYDSIDHAIALSAQCPFGLSASIFTKDIAKAKELASRIRAGSVIINDALAPTAHPDTPFGGRGDAGWGVTQGREGLLGMTVPQVVTVRKGSFRPHFDDAANPDPATATILGGLLKASHGGSFRSRLNGVLEMIRGIRRRR